MKLFLKVLFQRLFLRSKIFGNLDFSPSGYGSSCPGPVIRGWAFAWGGRMVKGRVRLDGMVWREFETCIERPDVQKACRKIKVPVRCGFEISCNWSDLHAREGNLTVEIFTEEETKLLLGPVYMSRPPIIGHAECQLSGGPGNEVNLQVKGWAAADDGMPVRVRLSINGSPWGEGYALSPLALSSKSPSARFSGFFFYVPHPAFHGAGDTLNIDFFDYQGHIVPLQPPVPNEVGPAPGAQEESGIMFHWDAPLEGQHVPHITIRGWAVDPSKEMSEVVAVVNGREHPADTGLERPDVFQSYPQLEGSLYSGFALAIPWSEMGTDSARIRLIFRDCRGRELCSSGTRQVLRSTLSGGLELRAPVQYFIDHIVVEGWVYSIDPEPVVETLVDNQCLHSFHPTIPRKDREKIFKQQFPDISGGTILGFSEWLDLKGIPRKVSSLEVRVRNAAGEQQTLGSQVLHPLPRVQAGVYGEIEGPLSGAEIRRRSLPVRGWVLFSEGLPVRGEVLINGQYMSDVELFQRRDDLLPAALSIPSFWFSGFQTLVDLSGLSEGPFELTLRFHSERGSKAGFSPIRLYYRPAKSETAEELPPGFIADAGRRRSIAQVIHHSSASNGRTHDLEGPSLRICAASHNFNIEGAPIYLYTLLSQLSRKGKVNGRVLSPFAGELRDWFVREGFDAGVMDTPVYRDADCHIYEQAVAQGCRILQEGHFHLAFANTLESFWMVEAAFRAGVPCIWSIHESMDPRMYYPYNWPTHAQQALQCLRKAYALVFVSHATKAFFINSLPPRGIHMVIHSGIPMKPLDAYIESQPRDTVRRELGIAPDEIAITMIGSTYQLKGQHVFLQAARELLHRNPSLNLSFFVVGGVRGFYFRLLEETGASFDPQGQKVHLLTVVRNIENYYRASDILVCASFNESFPLVILEGMAHGLPIVTTPVVGISEQLHDEETGLFFQPGNVSDLVEKLQRLIESPERRRALGSRAFQEVRKVFTIDQMTSHYWNLFQRACSPGAPESNPLN